MDEITTQWRQKFRRRVRSWYRKHRRDLPWRKSTDAYRVWVSEIMLQQTQVATVMAYFTRFVRRFADVESLAAAKEQDVLRLWEGLGYYRRARQMHAAAQQIVAQYGGMFPQDVVELRKLPGIGRYTAGAIASIAFDRPEPILEANTERLLARVAAYNGDPKSSAGQKHLWSVAKVLVPHKEPGEFNQALMELGSLICTPKVPDCDACPVSELCEAHATDAAHTIPATKRRQTYEARHEVAVVIRRNGKLLMRECAAGERWAGLWDFPRVDVTDVGATQLGDHVGREVAQQTGVDIELGDHCGTIKHGVTKYRIMLDWYAATVVNGRVRSSTSRTIRWIAANKLDDLPLCTTGRKIARQLQM